MKRCLLFLLLITCTCYSFCQTNDSLSALKDHYLRKSKTEVTTGAIVMGIGAGLSVYAYAEGASTLLSIIKLKPKAPPKGTQAILIAGNVLFLGGASLLVIGELHRSKAMHLKLGMQQTQALLPAGRIRFFSQPALTLSFSLPNRTRID